MANKKNTLITDKGYYLGITKDNEKVYLEKPSWDCEWYWGFGYLEYYNSNGRPTWRAHRHWDSLLEEQSKNHLSPLTALKSIFKKLTLSDDSLWKLIEYMKSYYTLSTTARLYSTGNSGQTKVDLNLWDAEEAERINHTVLPQIFEQINLLFTGDAD